MTRENDTSALATESTGGWVPYELSSAPLYAKSTTADIEEPDRVTVNAMIFVPPIDPAEARLTPLEKTPNIATQADFSI